MYDPDSLIYQMIVLTSKFNIKGVSIVLDFNYSKESRMNIKYLFFLIKDLLFPLPIPQPTPAAGQVWSLHDSVGDRATPVLFIIRKVENGMVSYSNNYHSSKKLTEERIEEFKDTYKFKSYAAPL